MVKFCENEGRTAIARSLYSIAAMSKFAETEAGSEPSSSKENGKSCTPAWIVCGCVLSPSRRSSSFR